MNLASFQDNLVYHFKNIALLQAALTHRSYAYEHTSPTANNQRLEFLGDAVLDLVIGEELFRSYPNEQEGFLSKERSRLVCEGALCRLARKLDFEHVIRMGKGESELQGALRDGTLADAYEAVIGAVYLDGGLQEARKFILHHHHDYLQDLNGNWLPRDAKTRLQEKIQAIHKNMHYEVISQTGPCHNPSFHIAVFSDDLCLGQGTGHSKKEAQQAAAQNALDRWNEQELDDITAK